MAVASITGYSQSRHPNVRNSSLNLGQEDTQPIKQGIQTSRIVGLLKRASKLKTSQSDHQIGCELQWIGFRPKNVLRMELELCWLAMIQKEAEI